MRRYTAVKSNVYAPVTTNLLSQNLIHNHMASHYRMTYFAKSKVDTSPPWQYRVSPDRMRKKSNKFTTRSSKATGAYLSECELQNQSLVDRILYDTKQPPSAYRHECVARRKYMISEPRRKEAYRAETSIKEVTKDTFCDNMDGITSFNLSINKQRSIASFRNTNGQTWTKKMTCSTKRNVMHGKHKGMTQEGLRENIPRPLVKSRIYHPPPRRAGYQDDRIPISSGSEGNAGDDEDGTPTSSCDDSNPTRRDNKKSLMPIRKVNLTECDSSHKCVLEKIKVDPCLCLSSIKEAEKTESGVSSRDSAYEGGEGMSSAENQRTSPDWHENRSKWFSKYFGTIYKTEEKKSKNQIASEKVPISCGKSELYMKFLQDVTDDVLVQEVYTNEALEVIFQNHIDRNVYDLDMNYMKMMIEKLERDLGITPTSCRDVPVYSDETKQETKVPCEIPLNSEFGSPIKMREADSKANKVVEAPLNTILDRNIENKKKDYCWSSKSEDHKKNSFVTIDQNFTMTKREVLDYLSDMGFEDSMSEEIFNILAGKCCADPDFTLQELQEIMNR